jgi:hypothetical protein
LQDRLRLQLRVVAHALNPIALIDALFAANQK